MCAVVQMAVIVLVTVTQVVAVLKVCAAAEERKLWSIVRCLVYISFERATDTETRPKPIDIDRRNGAIGRVARSSGQ